MITVIVILFLIALVAIPFLVEQRVRKNKAKEQLLNLKYLKDLQVTFQVKYSQASLQTGSLTFVGAIDGETYYIGFRRHGFVFNKDMSVGYTTDKSTLDETVLDNEYLIKAVKMLISQGLIKTK